MGWRPAKCCLLLWNDHFVVFVCLFLVSNGCFNCENITIAVLCDLLWLSEFYSLLHSLMVYSHAAPPSLFCTRACAARISRRSGTRPR